MTFKFPIEYLIDSINVPLKFVQISLTLELFRNPISTFIKECISLVIIKTGKVLQLEIHSNPQIN